MNKIYPSRLTTGEEYTGNQAFKGAGIQRWCAKCESHRATGNGSHQRVQGVMQWVCKQHPKVTTK